MTAKSKGILAILMSAFGFALMAFFVRLCDFYGGEVSSFQKSFFRNLIAFFIAGSIFLGEARRDGELKKSIAKYSKKAWALLTLRSVGGAFGIFGNFYALSHIPIGEGMTLNKTSPFFAVLFSWLFLRERAKLSNLLWLVIAFTGAVLVMKPGFAGDDTFATLCALGGGLGAGIAYTCVRELGVMKVNGAFIVLFFSAFSTLASVPFMIANGIDAMTSAQIVIMLLAGAGAAIGQFGVTAAYRFAPPKEIAVFDYSNVVFTALLGFAFLPEHQIPDALSAFGFVLILFAALKSRH